MRSARSLWSLTFGHLWSTWPTCILRSLEIRSARSKLSFTFGLSTFCSNLGHSRFAARDTVVDHLANKWKLLRFIHALRYYAHMFTPSREKVEAAERYLEEIRKKPKGFANSRRSQAGLPLWRNLPIKWRSQADADLQRLTLKYWREKGHAPSRQVRAALIGNIVKNILYCKVSHKHLSAMWRYWNAKKCARGGYTRNPGDRTGFTPRTTRARSSVGNLSGI